MIAQVLRIVPQGLLSRTWGRLARLELPPTLQAPINRAFARLVHVDLDESERPAEAYESLAAFFSRALREGARSWPIVEDVPGSPCDGTLGAHGELSAGAALQAKGRRYSVADLLGSTDDGDRFRSGVFLTIYLSPRHYHRVHAPCAATLHTARTVPGRLLPVGPAAVNSIPDLFPRNERLVAIMDCRDIEIAVVAVGAFNVGAISADFDPGWSGGSGRSATNYPGRGAGETRAYAPPLSLLPGDPLMTFHLGSTVIVLIRPKEDRIARINGALAEGSEIRAGVPLLNAPRGQ